MIPDLHSMPPDFQAKHAALNGKYNDFPPKWREIQAAEFAQSRHFVFHPVMYEFRQMLRNAHGSCLSATLHWQADGTGFALVNDYWKETIKFYAFGERTPGLVEHFDSSD